MYFLYPYYTYMTSYTFSLSRRVKILYIVLAVPLLVLFLVTSLMPVWAPELNKLYFFLGPLSIGFAGLLIYSLFQLNERITLDHERVKISSRFHNRELLHEDIAGYRLDDKYLYLVPLPGHGKRIRVTRYIDNFSGINVWARKYYTNLDEQDAAALYEGSSKQQVDQRIKRARWEVYGLNGLLLVLAELYLFTSAKDIALIILMICPWITLALLARHQPLVTLDQTKGPTPSILIPFIINPMLLFVWTRDMHVLNYGKIWLPAIIGAALYAALFLYYGRQLIKKTTQYIAAVLVILGFFASSYASILHLNRMTDKKEVLYFKTTVLDKRVVKGNVPTFDLKLSPWGPIPQTEFVSVPKKVYQHVEVNDNVVIALSEGGFGIPWYTVQERGE